MTSSLKKNKNNKLSTFFSDERTISFNNAEVKLFICKYDITSFDDALYTVSNIHLPKNIQSSVTKRRAEFLAGRYAAKNAIKQQALELSDMTIAIGQARTPIWPTGLLGSISHSTNYAACAITSENKTENRYLGIDIENHIEVETAQQLNTLIHTDHELMQLVHSGLPEHIATTLIFSAKESLFKALYPKLQIYFEFTDVHIIGISKETNTLTMSLSEKLLMENTLKQRYECHYSLEKDHVLTIVYGLQ